MPRYIYECDNPECPSGGMFDEFQSIKDDALEQCFAMGEAVGKTLVERCDGQ